MTKDRWIIAAVAGLALVSVVAIQLSMQSTPESVASIATPTVTVTTPVTVRTPGAATTTYVTVTIPGPTVTRTAPRATVTKQVRVTVEPQPPAVASGSTMTDGFWAVGEDVRPGRWRVTAAVGERCYWKISRSGTGGDDIIDNDLPRGGFPQVTLRRGQDFTTSNCGTWALKP